MPDSPRLVALFGIVVIDVRFIAFAAPAGLDEPASETALDLVTARLVNGLALFKTHGLFSFMSRVGLGFLMRAWARQGLNFGSLYRNRMIGLWILCIARGCLLPLRSSIRSLR